MQKSHYKKNEDPDVQISKALTYYLRHGAEKEGLSIRADGFVLVDALLAKPNLQSKNLSYSKLKQIVDTNDKKRFELQEILDTENNISQLYIRATQGHTMKSVEDDLLLTKIEDSTTYPIIVHGTYNKFWKSIKSQGLKTMTRNHVHLAPGYPGEKEVISGMRKNCDLFIQLDMEKAMADGMVFYLSKNNVILTSGFDKVIHPKYFKLVKDIYNKVLFENNDVMDIGEEEKKSPEEIGLKKKPEIKENQLDYLLVLDFEAQCQENTHLEIQEIIEFPVVPINLKTGLIEKEIIFHRYIKPSKIPILTQFCKDLTGISQDLVDKGIYLEEALELLHTHLTKTDILNKKWCFLTCGDWDIHICLKNEALKKKLQLKDYMKRWINIKKVFEKEFEGCAKKFGMTDMLEKLKLELDGRHHSGIDDSLNIAKIALKLIEKGVKFTTKLLNEYK